MHQHTQIVRNQETQHSKDSILRTDSLLTRIRGDSTATIGLDCASTRFLPLHFSETSQPPPKQLSHNASKIPKELSLALCFLLVTRTLP